MSSNTQSLWSITTVVVLILISIAGAIIGIQLLTTLGITPNTSVIGALVAMIMGQIPVRIFNKFKSIHVQNLAQTAISSATFGAANSLLIPIAVPYVMGMPELVLPMLAGISAAMLLDAYLLYRLFDSKIFPASAAWPMGIASANVIQAGDKGGFHSRLLIGGVLLGLGGSFVGLSMSAFGLAFIGNVWALLFFGGGLLLKIYSNTLASIDLGAMYVPHGVMVGAGLVALFQVAGALKIPKKGKMNTVGYDTNKNISVALGIGGIGYLLIAIFLAFITGLYTQMNISMLIAFIIYAALTAFIHELIVGLAAMHSGWFPAFAVALITLLIGIMLGFPPLALCVLASFTAATGPAFADMGFDLKAGFILRHNGANLEEELLGRRAQLIAGMIAFLIAIIVVFFSWESFFSSDRIPPIAKVYNQAIMAGTSLDLAKNLLLWGIPGAILQFVGGSKRQLGIMLATGLLIGGIHAGWAVIVGIIIRLIFSKVTGDIYKKQIETIAAGCIAGDAIFSFFNNVIQFKNK